MFYMTKEMLRENARVNAALFDREDVGKIRAAEEFLRTEEGHDKNLLALIDDILNSRDTLYYSKNFKFYIFVVLIEWFMLNNFLPNMKGGERVLVASNLASKIANDLEEKLK